MLPDPARRGAQARETFLRDARDAKLLAQLKNAPPSTITEQDIRVMQRLKLRRLYGEVESKFYRQASKTQLLPVFRDGGVVWKTARRVGKVKGWRLSSHRTRWCERCRCSSECARRAA